LTASHPRPARPPTPHIIEKALVAAAKGFFLVVPGIGSSLKLATYSSNDNISLRLAFEPSAIINFASQVASAPSPERILAC
jgi:hypothetical protein